jgi:hypothetical protein
MDFLGFDAIRAGLKEAEGAAMPELVILRFDASDGGRIVILEDDGRTAYAYLLARGVVVSSVWLYNVAEAPILADWSLDAKSPLLNPRAYCNPAASVRIRSTSQVECTWFASGVEIAIDGLLWACLKQGSAPGWSRGAAVGGPLAKPFPSGLASP